jgi:hypothetical protein
MKNKLTSKPLLSTDAVMKLLGYRSTWGFLRFVHRQGVPCIRFNAAAPGSTKTSFRRGWMLGPYLGHGNKEGNDPETKTRKHARARFLQLPELIGAGVLLMPHSCQKACFHCFLPPLLATTHEIQSEP